MLDRNYFAARGFIRYGAEDPLYHFDSLMFFFKVVRCFH
jgi:hypothetical protein